MKKRFIFVILLLVLMIGIMVVESALTTLNQHSSDNIKINSGKTLTQTISDGLTYNSLSFSSIKDDPGHSADEIWVSIDVNGQPQERTLAQAISTQGICGGGTPTNPTINTYVLSTEIEISPGRTLQDAINNQEILYQEQEYSQCEDNDKRRWYDSCNRAEDVRNNCPSKSCDSFSWSCTKVSTWVAREEGSRDCYDIECNGDTCSNPSFDGGETYNCPIPYNNCFNTHCVDKNGGDTHTFIRSYDNCGSRWIDPATGIKSSTKIKFLDTCDGECAEFRYVCGDFETRTCKDFRRKNIDSNDRLEYDVTCTVPIAPNPDR